MGSRKQTSVATSSTESEYMAMSACAKQSQWIVQVLKDMGFPRYIGNDPYVAQIKGDNQGALALVKNPHLHERSKHIDVQYHHIRDLEAQKRIAVSYIMVADCKSCGQARSVVIPAGPFKGLQFLCWTITLINTSTVTIMPTSVSSF